MARHAHRTTDHEVIRKWVEERDGNPARVLGTGDGGDPGVLRIDFPGYSGEGTLERIDWDAWFEKFDRNELAFLFQDGESRFNKLVRGTSEDTEGGVSKEDRELARAGARGTSRVTIMNASREELDALWGVGEQNAERIIRFRRRRPIRSEQDLRNVPGFDSATAHLIASQVDFG